MPTDGFGCLWALFVFGLVNRLCQRRSARAALSGKRGVIAMIQEILNALVAVTNVLSFLIKVAEKIHRS